jgi:hypothetical protein
MRAAFAEIVDYAGLFPPATSSMTEAVVQYDRYRRSQDRWMLGRFVVAAPRLEELGQAVLAEEVALVPADPWRLSVVLGTSVVAEVRQLEAFRAAWDSRGIRADSVEVKVASADDLLSVHRIIPEHLRRFFEVPRGAPYSDLLQAIGRAGGYAKMRTGGTTPELFPAAADVAAFLAAAVAGQVPFKATAGLHHPFRGLFPITYEPDAPTQMMHGFVNVLLATTALVRGDVVAIAEAILADSDRASFVVAGEAISWRDRRFAESELAAAHERYFLGFGSCSFREPHDELDLEHAR